MTGVNHTTHINHQVKEGSAKFVLFHS